jgi:uncharacterized repeat protein (TIGR03803 family)
MLLNSRNLGVAGVLLPAIFTFLVVATPAWAQTESVLYNFCSIGDLCADGAYPIAPLTSDGTGNFYGTTHSGGQSGTYGAVFELSPNGKGGWNETVLHSFTLGSDGAYPVFSPVVFDSAGNLYGTTEDGGAGYGVVFELSPFEKSWAEKAIYTFKNSGDGGSPQSGVTVDASGNLFGVTPSGGPGNSATVFELSPSGSTWTEQVIYTFDNSDIIAPSGLAIDSRGNIFGAANLTVFELSPDGTGGWNPTTLHVFPDQGLGIEGTPVLDNTGSLYGTIMYEQSNGVLGQGEVYRLREEDGRWELLTLHTWAAGDGPYAGVTLDAAGHIYGTTTGGGSNGLGTVFELVAANNNAKAYRAKVLWNFNGPDGSMPICSPTLDNSGKLYGTTDAGGSIGYGTVFEVTP